MYLIFFIRLYSLKKNICVEHLANIFFEKTKLKNRFFKKCTSHVIIRKRNKY